MKTTQLSGGGLVRWPLLLSLLTVVFGCEICDVTSKAKAAETGVNI